MLYRLAITLTLATTLGAQNADKILSQHVSALGSSRAVKTVATIEYHGEAREGDAEPASFTLTLHTPNLIYIELASPDHGWSQADNGKSSWRRDASGLHTLAGPESKQLRAVAYFLNTRFVDYKKDKWEPRYVGPADLAGRKTDLIEMTNSASELSGTRLQFWFDAATHLLLKLDQPDGAYILFDDYRPEKGVQQPHRLTVHQGTQTLDAVLDRVTPNPAFHPEMFDYPKAALTNPPDMNQLFADLAKHQSDLNDVRRRYSCTLDETVQDVDGKGKLQKTSERRYYLFYLGERHYRKLIADQGRQLSEDELKHEDERIAEAQRRDAHSKPKSQRIAEAEDDMVRDILKVMQFFNFRREPFRGREVLVFDFSAKPNYKPHGLTESLIAKLVGTMWVDETDHQVARVQARTASAFKVGAGLLASLDPGASLVVEQDKVNNEVWLPIFQEVHLSARMLLVKGTRANRIARYSDYKKFTAGSTITFK